MDQLTWLHNADIPLIAPFVISGIICVGVWVGGVFKHRVTGWTICIVGHLSFMLYGVMAERYGFLFIPPLTALGLVITIRRYQNEQFAQLLVELSYKETTKEE
jgi:hypothetical protein